MSGAALTRVESQISVVSGYANAAIQAAEAALSKLSSLEFSSTNPTIYSFSPMPVYSPNAVSQDRKSVV